MARLRPNPSAIRPGRVPRENNGCVCPGAVPDREAVGAHLAGLLAIDPKLRTEDAVVSIRAVWSELAQNADDFAEDLGLVSGAQFVRGVVGHEPHLAVLPAGRAGEFHRLADLPHRRRVAQPVD